MVLKIQIEKKYLYFLIAITMFLVSFGIVFAFSYNQAILNPGHGADQVWIDVPNQGEMTLQDAIDQGICCGGGGGGAQPCSGTLNLTTSGSVSGCRKGRATGDSSWAVPINFSDSGSKRVMLVSDVRVRKQSNCGTFHWDFTISCVNGQLSGGTTKASPIKENPSTSGDSLVKEWPARYYNSGDSLNGYINMKAYVQD